MNSAATWPSQIQLDGDNATNQAMTRREKIASAAERLRARQSREEDGACVVLRFSSGQCGNCHATADGLHAFEESADSPTKLFCKLC